MQPLHLGKEDQKNWDTKNTLSLGYWRGQTL